MTIQALPYVLTTAFFFGTTLIASRFSVGQIEPTTYITFRFMIASFAFLMLYAVRHKPLPRDHRLWFHAGLFGIFGTVVNQLSIVSSLQYHSSGLAAVLMTTMPVVTALFAHIFLPEERLSGRQWGGVILALGGAFLLTLSGENGLPDVSTDPRGYVLIGIGIVFGGGMTVYARRALHGYDSIEVSSIRVWVAALAIIPVNILFVGFDVSALTVQGAGAVLWAALIGTFAGFFTQFYVINRFGAIASGMIPYFNPIVSGIGGIILLHETFTPVMLVGIVIIMAGITLVQNHRIKITA